MEEIKEITWNNPDGEIVWEGVLLPLGNGDYEGYIRSSMRTYINFEYWGWDVKMILKRQNPETKKIDTSLYDLTLVNRLGRTEWFTTSDRNTIICTKEKAGNVLETSCRKKLEYNKRYIR